MNRIFATFAIALVLQISGQASAEFSTREERREQCIAWMMTDYPSGLEEGSCISEFSLPSAFMFKCAKAGTDGFRNAVQRDACHLFFVNAARDASLGYVRN